MLSQTRVTILVVVILSEISYVTRAIITKSKFGNSKLPERRNNNILKLPSRDAKSFYAEYVERMVYKWAPLIWLAPEEQFFPLAVNEFLQHVVASSKRGNYSELPVGQKTDKLFLVTKSKIDDMLSNSSSILYGRDPSVQSVPVYAHVVQCGLTNFHVTYWFFFPYNQGKSVCTINVRLVGLLPIPKLNNKCYGQLNEFGSHVGDWEHASFIFDGKEEPEQMYTSAHDAGAFYKFDRNERIFKFEKQEVRKGFMQRPKFPSIVKIYNSDEGSHPILFSAKGSHGLWTAPGEHKYVRLPRLYDVSGYGTAWKTWNNIHLINGRKGLARWMLYYGKWGNPRSKCHPLSKMGLHICQQTDGPNGIPTKKPNFACSRTLR